MSRNKDDGSLLQPLPMRITKQQYAKLRQLRQETGLSVQEIIRRAIDTYGLAHDQSRIIDGLIEECRRLKAARPLTEDERWRADWDLPNPGASQ